MTFGFRHVAKRSVPEPHHPEVEGGEDPKGIPVGKREGGAVVSTCMLGERRSTCMLGSERAVRTPNEARDGALACWEVRGR